LARVVDLGRLPYAEAWAIQSRQLALRIANEVEDTAFLVEHDPVYTVGRKLGAMANVLAPGDVPVVEVERGGDVTFHGPGQLVVYPVFALCGRDRDLHAWLRRLESLCFDVMADFGLHGERDPRGTGAWVRGRKIASIGIACRRWVTWHGVALNVTTDLDYLSRVQPCGLDPSVYTSMERELGSVDFVAVKSAFSKRLADW